MIHLRKSWLLLAGLVFSYSSGAWSDEAVGTQKAKAFLTAKQPCDFALAVGAENGCTPSKVFSDLYCVFNGVRGAGTIHETQGCFLAHYDLATAEYAAPLYKGTGTCDQKTVIQILTGVNALGNVMGNAGPSYQTWLNVFVSNVNQVDSMGNKFEPVVVYDKFGVKDKLGWNCGGQVGDLRSAPGAPSAISPSKVNRANLGATQNTPCQWGQRWVPAGTERNGGQIAGRCLPWGQAAQFEAESCANSGGTWQVRGAFATDRGFHEEQRTCLPAPGGTK